MGVVVVPAIHSAGVVNMDKVYVEVDVIDENVNVVNVRNKDNPEQALPSQVVEVDICDKDHGDVDVVEDNENMNVMNADNMNEGKSEQVLECGFTAKTEALQVNISSIQYIIDNIAVQCSGVKNISGIQYITL